MKSGVTSLYRTLLVVSSLALFSTCVCLFYINSKPLAPVPKLTTSDISDTEMEHPNLLGFGTFTDEVTSPASSEDLSPEGNPLLQELVEPSGQLVRPQATVSAAGEQSSQQSGGDEQSSGEDVPALPSHEGAVKATLMSLVRNSELDGIVQSMKQIEATFNSKFGYPWTFFNDAEFSELFKQTTQKATKSKCTYITIDPQDWQAPEWIDEKKKKAAYKRLKKQGVQYGDLDSYHKMCRWNSGKFYSHPHMLQYKYYWRVEPKTEYYCDIGYDVFAYMEDHDKDYGFVINLYDSPESVASLWNASTEFFNDNTRYVATNNSRNWLLNEARPDHNEIAGYSTCHFWSNFEIGNLEFFRSEAYEAYFSFLDKQGGFFYERWGDAPVHSIALSLMLDKDKIHWFKDIGYRHDPYFNCPNSDKCSCQAGQFSPFSNLNPENCMNEWHKVAGESYHKK